MTNGIIIFYIGMGIGLFYLIFNAYRQLSASATRNDKIRKAKNEYELAKSEKANVKKKLLNAIAKSYGIDQAKKVSDGTIWIGMPMHLLMVALGKAYDIKEKIYRGNRTEKWYYGEYQTRLGTYKYKLEITLENDIVAGWKDLT